MALVDKIYDGELNQDIFAAALWFWSKGDVTRQNVIDGLKLDVTDEVQLDLLVAAYQARSTEDKQIFNGLITKTKFQSLLDL